MAEGAVTVIALLVAGYLLLALEAFIIPGFGVAGVAGLLCLVAGCYLAVVELGPAYGTLTIFLVLVSVTALAYWIPRSPFGKNVVLSSSLDTATSPKVELSPGDVGVAESDLRPAGIARFGERRESVVTEGEFIDSGARVHVSEVRGSRVVVELHAEDALEHESA